MNSVLKRKRKKKLTDEKKRVQGLKGEGPPTVTSGG